jgi:hypothetical protein
MQAARGYQCYLQACDFAIVLARTTGARRVILAVVLERTLARAKNYVLGGRRGEASSGYEICLHYMYDSPNWHVPVTWREALPPTLALEASICDINEFDHTQR